MAIKLQRPVLIGGLGLSFSLWLLDSWQDTIAQLGEYGLFSLLTVGGGLWLLKQNRPKNSNPTLAIIPPNRETVEKAIAKAEAVITQFSDEAEKYNCVNAVHQVSTLREQATQLYVELDRQEIKLAVIGGKSVGKTTLIEVLKSNWGKQAISKTVSILETPALFTGASCDEVSLKQAAAADLVLFLTNGDLTDTEFKTVQQLQATNQRVMLVFNKQDQYQPDERASILLSLKQRMQSNVVATAVSPLAIKVRKHSEDGSVEEWMEQPEADIKQLTLLLSEVLATQGFELVWATTMRKASVLQKEAKDLLNSIRKERALPIIEQYQWIAAAAAFANPVPALDILGTAAINAQMVIDLGNIYQQKFSIEQAKTVAGEMGGLMLKLGLVEISSKAIGTVLKSHAVTFVAGGVVQGVSAAFLTRLAALSLVEYLQQQEISVNSGNKLNLEKLGQVLQKVFTQNQQMAVLQGFAKQGVKRLLPEAEVAA
jgi:uncharacterized protein